MDGAGELTRALERADRRTAVALLTAAGDDRERRDPLLDVLALQAAAGSALATELLVETVDRLQLAHRMIHGVLVDRHAVDDVAQDTLVAIATGIHRFRGEAAFTTWLHRLARNRAVDHLRRQRATSPLPNDDVGDAARVSSVIATQATIHDLIAQLPELYRQPLILRELDRLPYDEVAQRLGANVNTVRSHVARGRALMARLLGDAAELGVASEPPEGGGARTRGGAGDAGGAAPSP